MSIRLGAAAVMAAILATLVVLIARAVVDPPVMPDIAGRESFLFQHILLAVAAAPVFQIAFLVDEEPDYRSGLRWGIGSFAAAVVAPLLVMPHLPTGALPLHDGNAMLFWLTTVAVTGTGLWLIWRNGGPLRGDARGRIIGAVLLFLPGLLEPASGLPGELEREMPADPMAVAAASGDMVMLLGLNLLFWVALGLASVLAAHRVVHQHG